MAVLPARRLRALRGNLRPRLGLPAVGLVLLRRGSLLLGPRPRRAPCVRVGVVGVVLVVVVVVVVAVGPTVVKRRPEGALPTGSGCLPGVLSFALLNLCLNFLSFFLC